VLYVSSPDGQENIKEQEEVKNEKKGRKRKKKKSAYIKGMHTSLFSPAHRLCQGVVLTSRRGRRFAQSTTNNPRNKNKRKTRRYIQRKK
jgi:hypothetical protein